MGEISDKICKWCGTCRDSCIDEDDCDGLRDLADRLRRPAVQGHETRGLRRVRLQGVRRMAGFCGLPRVRERVHVPGWVCRDSEAREEPDVRGELHQEGSGARVRAGALRHRPRRAGCTAASGARMTSAPRPRKRRTSDDTD
jgi:hypothetical protein